MRLKRVTHTNKMVNVNKKQVSQFKNVSFDTMDIKSQHEVVRNSHYNVPFGYLDEKNKFQAFVNIDVDEGGDYVYYKYGNKHSISQLVSKEKRVPIEEWMNHVVIINDYGKTTPLKKLQVRVKRDYGLKKEIGNEKRVKGNKSDMETRE